MILKNKRSASLNQLLVNAEKIHVMDRTKQQVGKRNTKSAGTLAVLCSLWSV